MCSTKKRVLDSNGAIPVDCKVAEIIISFIVFNTTVERMALMSAPSHLHISLQNRSRSFLGGGVSAFEADMTIKATRGLS